MLTVRIPLDAGCMSGANHIIVHALLVKLTERSPLPRKNALFAVSDGGAEHWAVIASAIETCKLIAVEPYRYLADVIALTRIVDGRSQSRLDELLPWVYSATPNLKAVA